MRWTDIAEIVEGLMEEHPEVDPAKVQFVKLREWIMSLPDFDDDPKRSGEKILEAIQQHWIDEAI